MTLNHHIPQVPVDANQLTKLSDAARDLLGIGIRVLDRDGNLLFDDVDPEDTAPVIKEERAAELELFREVASDFKARGKARDGGCVLFGVPLVDANILWGVIIGRCRNGKPGADQECRDHQQVLQRLQDLGSLVAENCYKEYVISSLTAELAGRYEELCLIYEIGQNMNVAADLQESLDLIFSRSLEILGFDCITLTLSDTDDCLVFKNQTNSEAAPAVESLNRMTAEARKIVLSEGQPLVINDLRKDHRFADFRGRYTGLLSLPLELGENKTACLCVLNSAHGRPFTTGDIKLVSALGKEAAVVIKNAELIQNIKSLFLNTIRTLVSTIEAKDDYTRGHSERVNRLALLLGQKVRLSSEERESLNWASLLHDIGKISVPETILNKPGKLTREEWRVVEAHSCRGHEMLSPIVELGESLIGVLHHHERYDGGGYPAGLKGEEIPLIARIIAVADTFDALTSHRPYRPSMSWEKARNIIQECAGTQLDPQLAGIFVRDYQEFVELLRLDKENTSDHNVRTEPSSPQRTRPGGHPETASERH